MTPAEYDADSKGPLPWQCWDIPNFKSCATEAGHATYRQLQDHNLQEGSPAWNELYPQVYRNKVYDCQLASGCAPSQLAQTKVQTVPGSAPLPTSTAQQSLAPSLLASSDDDKTKWLIAAGAGLAVVLFLFYKAKK